MCVVRLYACVSVRVRAHARVASIPAGDIIVERLDRIRNECHKDDGEVGVAKRVRIAFGDEGVLVLHGRLPVLEVGQKMEDNAGQPAEEEDDGCSYAQTAVNSSFVRARAREME